MPKYRQKMGHKNSANFKFWSHKKIFPPGPDTESVAQVCYIV